MAAKSRLTFQTIGLFAMIIVFPAMSWYYLQAGYNYQLDARSELVPYHQIQSGEFSPKGEKYLSFEDLKGSLSLFGVLSKGEDSDKYFRLMDKLCLQFADEKVFFITMNMDSTADYSSLNDCIAEGNIQVAESERTQVEALIKQFKVPKIEAGRNEEGAYNLGPVANDWKNYPYLVLVDEELNIINYYNRNDENQVKRLVEHVAMVMPREKQMKPEIYREKEK